MAEKPPACLFVIFGASGDLMHRKLLPALRRLMGDGLLPKRCRILGVGRDAKLKGGAARIDYQGIGAGSAADYERLAARIAGIERRHGLNGNRVVYLALPPVAFPGTIEALGKSGLNRSKGWTRLVIEKPFGHDLASARSLNALVHRYFDEAQVYRIDHYLGKEAVQNLLAFRFGNALFESAWNRESVRITVAEALGIEGRAGYYERTGALRDMVQNHLTQLLTLAAMEVPATFDADSIRFEKVKVLRSVAPIRDGAVVFGQYGPGQAGRKKLAGYRDEPGVAARSRTETFVSLQLEIDNWRWQGVPFRLCTGKRLARQATEIAIKFRRPPVALFRSLDGCAMHTNVLVMTLQPDEGFDLSFQVKAPGERFTLHEQHMTFRYDEAFGKSRSRGYETLLLEIVRGDQTLFVHADEAEAAWRIYTPLLRKRWRLHPYAAGGAGPAGLP
jgi:glucose-6-phosphate 1-dehydrogenase